MEVAMEDDVLLADLNRQISLLIMDDDENPTVHHPSASLQGFPQAIQHPTYPSYFLPNDPRRQIKGTGVFIPQSSQPRRKNNKKGGRGSSSYTTGKCNSKQNVINFKKNLPSKPE